MLEGASKMAEGCRPKFAHERQLLRNGSTRVKNRLIIKNACDEQPQFGSTSTQACIAFHDHNFLQKL